MFGSLGSGFIYFGYDLSLNYGDLIKEMKRVRGKIDGAFGIGLKKLSYLDHLDKKLFSSVKKRNDSENKFNPAMWWDLAEKLGEE